MKILIIEPGKDPRREEISSSLEAMQKVVGGYIQAVYPFEDHVALICNEEGKLLGLPFNRRLVDEETGVVYDYIAGTFFLCAAPADADDFASLTEEQLERFEAYYRWR